MDAFHTRLSYRLSKPIPLANAAHLHPYARLGGSVLTSRGGAIRNGHQRLRLNIDGARMELGLGAVWQPAAAHQLHLDYEVSHGEKYAQLWGLTAGYRWQF
ncbi:MAG: autotransporter outer membrane beta-barrel domain-containing protein [Opitutaceae bacterium]|nr:autotransporter outer membrane beta-barrel domain-containing protein [Opitutaceae bacterium]